VHICCISQSTVKIRYASKDADNSDVLFQIYRSIYALTRVVTEPAKIRIRRMWISCAKSVGCGFVARSQLPAIMATAIQLSYLK